MNKNKIIAGIELGSSKIATIISQVNIDQATMDKEINIVGVSSSDSKGIKKGQIVDIEAAVESIISSVESAERMAGYHLESAYIALNGAHLHSQNSHGVVAVSDPEGEISISDVDRVIEAASALSIPQSREVIHVLPREFVVDGESGVKDPVGMSGIRLEVDTHIITAASSAMKNIKKAINEVGIQVEEFVFNGLAASESSITSTEKELGCVVVDIGGGTTSICGFIDGAITYSGVIPIGAKNVTNDLAIGLRISLENAEKIKLELSKEQKNLKEDEDEMDLTELGITDTKKVSKKTLIEGIVRPRLNEIFTMVRLELDKAGILNKVPSGIIITGGGAETVGVVDCARRMASLPVRIGKPRGVKGLIDDIMNPSFSVPVGLIVYGSEGEPKERTGGFGKRLKLPSFGMANKVIDLIKNLLP